VNRSFREDLALGHGRAWLRVKRGRGHGLEREIDRACLNDLSFDAQVEGPRAAWLYQIASMAGRLEALRPRVFRRLRASRLGTHSWSVQQNLELAAEYAAHGDARARELVLAFAQRHRRSYSGHSDGAVVRAAGVPGLEAAYDASAGVRALAEASARRRATR